MIRKKFRKNKTDFGSNGCFDTQKKYRYRVKALNTVFLDESTVCTLKRSFLNFEQSLLPFLSKIKLLVVFWRISSSKNVYFCVVFKFHKEKQCYDFSFRPYLHVATSHDTPQYPNDIDHYYPLSIFNYSLI